MKLLFREGEIIAIQTPKNKGANRGSGTMGQGDEAMKSNLNVAIIKIKS